MKHLPTHQPNRSRFALVFLLFMTFLLGSVQGWGQVSTLQAFSNLYNGTSNSQNLTYAFSAGTNSNRLLVVAVTTTLSSAANNRTIALTYGGRSLTLATGDLTTNSQQHTAIYYLTESEIDLASNTTLAFTATNGTTRVNMVWAAVYDYVNQTTPLNNSRNYNSGTNTTSSFSFGTALSLASGNQGVVLICSQRLNNNNSRTITYPTNWSLGNEQTATNTDAMRSGVAARTIPTATTTDNCATTFSGNALASMTGIAINGCSQPTVNAGSALSAICIGGTSAGLGGSVGGSATGGTWTSSVSGGTFLPNATTLNATYTPPSNYTGTVTLTLTTSGGSCGTATASKTLIVNSPPTASAGGVQTICQGNTATVSGASSSNGTIAWTENGSGSITSGATTSTPVYTSSSSDISQVTLTMTVSSAGCANATATYTVYVTANPTAGTLSGTQAICANSTTTFTVSGSSGGTGFFSTNNSSVATVNSTTGVVSGISAGSATITYTVTGSSGCFATATRNVTIAPAPTALTISPASATICNGDIQSLGVIGGVSTSSSVQTIGASGLTTTATSTTATLGPNPFQSYYGGTKQQMLFRASELSALGITNGVVISSISFNMSAVESRTLLNYVVKMKNTSTTAFSNTTFETGLTIVRTASSVTPIVGWNSLNLTSDFTYTGGNLIIEINFSNNDAGAVGTNIAFFDATAFASTLFYRVDNQTAATVDAASTASFSYSQRNSIKFSVSNSEQGNLTWSPTTALYTNSAATTSYTGSPSATVYAKPTETITYTATATSSAGCTSSNTIQVTVNNPTTYYADADGDTFGNASVSSSSCSQPVGYVTDNTDCNDANVSISPMAEEICDGIDNDCNASTADGLGTTVYFQDSDNDTFGNLSVSVVSCAQPSGYVLNNSDCNDNNATISYNVYYADADGDSFGDQESTTQGCSTPIGYVSNYSDCDDTKSAVNPNGTEICNEFDDDCDGLINEGVALSDYHQDSDGDGYGSGTAVALCQPTAGYVQNSLDCDDTNASANPNGQEICGNNVDEDCSGGDLYPSFYVSVAANGNWRQASTWNYSCDNSNFLAANYAPPADYTGDVLIAANTTVTVTKFPTASQTGILRIAANGNLVLEGNQATNAPTAANVGQIAKLTVLNGIVNNGTLTIGHHASLLQTSATANSGDGNFVVNVEFTGNNNGAATPAPNGRYWYLGSPMNNTNAGSTFLDPSNMVRLWGYNGSLNSWEVIVHSGTGATTSNTLIPGIGYLYRAGNNETVTYTGNAAAFNNNITSNLLQPTVTNSMVPLTGYQSSTGYKFVANPYMSHIDWKLVTRTGLNVSYWIRNASNTAYESYNATSGVSNSPSGQTIKDIPPMQGFWVYAFNTSPSLVINNGDRVHSSNVVHAPIHNQIVRLNLNDGKTDDQAVVYENDNANNGIEEYDTDKFMDENYHQVYFLEGSKQLSLDGLKDATAKQKVDMGIQITSAGTYTINATELGVEEDVVLEDKFTHTFQDLKRNSSYSFTSNAGTYNNRFVLHFTLNPQTESAIETETVSVTETVGETEGVNIYTTTGQQVKVWVTNTADFQNATVKVYDAVGNMIERKNMTSNELLLDLNTATGVYLVEVTGTEKVFTKKVFVTK